MRAYLAVTAALFTTLVIAHVARFTQESHLITDPTFVISSVVSLGMVIWALVLYRALSRRQ